MGSPRIRVRSLFASLQLFAGGPDDARGRRPIDALRAVLSLLLLCLAALSAEVDSAARRDLTRWLADLPGTLDAVWVVGFWVAIAWALALLVISAFRHRLSVAVEALAAVVLALAVSAALAALNSDQTGDVIMRIVDTEGPAVFPPGALASTSAVVAAMAPHVTQPFRRLGRILVVLQLAAVILLGIGEVDGAVAAVAIGLFAGAAFHLLRGSPAGFPAPDRIRAALADLGIDLDDLEPISRRREGAVLLGGTDREGSLEIKVYGRDAWDGALLASLWRHVWYRGSQSSAHLRRGEYVEHEGFMTFLAAGAGARVPQVVTAGLADNGDALIALRSDGTPLTEETAALTVEQVAALWEDLGRLHAGGIAHGRIDLDRVVTRADGSAGFGDLSSASVGRVATDQAADRAQLVALTIVTSGQEVAVERARSAVGADGLGELLPYLQEAAVPPQVRAVLRHRHVKLDATRGAMAEVVGADEVQLVALRRVTWKSLLSFVLLGVAAYTLIGTIGGLDLDTFARSLGDADWWWLFAALLIAQLPRAANALSTIGSTTVAVPFGPATALQFAMTYVNLAVPGSAGRIAVTTRFYQRFGIPPAAALSAGAIDSLSEMIVQLVLFVVIFSISDVDVGISISPEQLHGLVVTAAAVVAVLAVATVIVLIVPSLRRRLIEPLHEARDAGQVLRSPTKLLQLYGGNILSQVLFACALWACVHAFDENVSLSTLILINTAVSLFAGFMPAPGGVGVAEAGLAFGLARAGGVPSELALAIALTYRFATSYLPPIWGVLSYRWLTDRSYL